MKVGQAELGKFKRPIAFTFSNTVKEQFHIIRNVSVNFTNIAVRELQPIIPYKKQKVRRVTGPVAVVDGLPLSR